MSGKKKARKKREKEEVSGMEVWSAFDGMRNEMVNLRCVVLKRLDEVEFMIRDRLYRLRLLVEEKLGRKDER